ncbi:MAG: YdcF family protein [Alphaproteobacteria bacterium]|nr:YdcF family protein [Alphaproteobacteria bacterium]
MTDLAKALLLPPTGFLLLAAVALVVAKMAMKGGTKSFFQWLAALGLVGFLVFCTGFIGHGLLRLLEHPPVDPNSGAPGIDAIVVLSADIQRRAPEYENGTTIGSLTLVRLRYGAALARRLGLQIAVSGGTLPDSTVPIAARMAESLRADFGVEPRWIEDRSRNTCENARFTAGILRADGIERVYLVSHAWHMPRAILAFRRFGVEVVAAPTGFEPPAAIRPSDFVPSPGGYRASTFFFHEALGLLAYALTCR